MRLFISYSHVDKPRCKEIVDRLNAHEVWYDQQIYGGQRWWDEILNKLDWCQGFIYLMTNESLASTHCVQEYNIAHDLGKQIIPVMVRERTAIPENLRRLHDIQHVNLTEISVNSITELLNAVLVAERNLVSSQSKSLEILTERRAIAYRQVAPIKRQDEQQSLSTFNYTVGLSRRMQLSENTQRAYYRWLDNYLGAIASLEPTDSKTRIQRMSKLPLDIVLDTLSAAQVRTWLNTLVADDHGQNDIDQAKASVLALATLLRDDGLISDYVVQSIKGVSVKVSKNTDLTKRRVLSSAEMAKLVVAAGSIATSEYQSCRNELMTLFMCTLLMRRSEIAKLKWMQFTYTENQSKLLFSPDGNNYLLDTFPSVRESLERWQKMSVRTKSGDFQETHVIRRVWKGGNIGIEGLSPDGVWLVISDAANYAGMGTISPEDLRLSGALMLFQEYSYPIQKISQLMGNKSIVATSRFLDRANDRLLSQFNATFDLINVIPKPEDFSDLQ